MADDLLQAPAWTALQRHAEALSGTHLRDLLDQPGIGDQLCFSSSSTNTCSAAKSGAPT